MLRIWIRFLLTAVGVLLAPGVHRALAIEVYTPKELTAVNGTNVRLKCTFKSSHPVSETAASVSWSFKSFNLGKEEQLFHYQGEPFPPKTGQFKGHVAWTGDLLKNDGSITLNDVQFSFNGTYTCQVRNPPDVHGYTGEIRLEVVLSVKLSEIGILAAAVGGAIMLVLLILGIVLTVRFFRGRRGDAGIELPDSKRGTVCTTEEFKPMTTPEKDLEKSKLHEEEIDADGEVKGSGTNLNPADDD